jgi:carbon-monoxide dehydrogenase medium subunit
MLEIGALTRHYQVEESALVRDHCPLLAQAARTIGHYAIRQRGTLGGSLAHADPAAQLPLAAVVLDSKVEVASENGRKLVPAAEFFSSIFTTILEPHELIVALHVPVAQPRKGWGFRLFTRRAGDFALALVACTLVRTGKVVEDVRLAVGGVAPTPVRLDGGIQHGVRDAGWLTRAARAVATAAPIEENERICAEYRRELIEALAHDALAEALESAT